MDRPNPGTAVNKATLNSKSHFWSDQQQRPASRGENIHPGSFGIPGAGSKPTLNKSRGEPGLTTTHRYGQIKMDQDGSVASNNQQIVLPFRPATASPYSFGSGSVASGSSRPGGEENFIHDAEMRNKMLIANRTNNKRPPPLSRASEQINRTSQRDRPGTAGSNTNTYAGKQNVYRSSATLVTPKFVPILPLANKKWVTTTPTSEDSRPQVKVQPVEASPVAPPTPMSPTTIFSSFIPLPIRNTLGYIGDKIREQVSPSRHSPSQTHAEEVTQRVEVHQVTPRPFFKIDSRPSPLSSNNPALAPFLSPPHGDQLNPIHSIFQTCEQYTPIPIDIIFQDLRRIRKVGEGVYGEVYFAEFKTTGVRSVYKIVAVEGFKIVNGERQKRFSEIEPEILVSAQVNSLREPEFNMGINLTTGMAKLHWARVCKGKYPVACSLAWKQWNMENRSENEYPVFDDDQLYIVFEYEYGGTDMESYRFVSAAQSFALLIQVVHTLAAAENAVGFEHRDLHWGNILIQNHPEPTTKYLIQGKEFNVATQGIVSTIIDFTISRTNGKYGGSPAFTDLAADNDQFIGTGEYQFEIYRMMKKANDNNWAEFHPESNIYWCHYLVDKLLTKAKYAERTTRRHLRNMTNLETFKDHVLEYTSCTEFVMNPPEFLE